MANKTNIEQLENKQTHPTPPLQREGGKSAYMQMALEEAKKAYQQDEVPIGAVLVDSHTGEVIARAHNLCEQKDCTEHAEILAIQKACKELNQNRLWDMDLYVTLEPCIMCAGAISFARIRKLYFGAEDKKSGAVKNGVKFFESPTCHHKPEVESGIMEAECSSLVKDFFKAKRA